jgi:hypothetical protein
MAWPVFECNIPRKNRSIDCGYKVQTDKSPKLLGVYIQYCLYEGGATTEMVSNLEIISKWWPRTFTRSWPGGHGGKQTNYFLALEID